MCSFSLFEDFVDFEVFAVRGFLCVSAEYNACPPITAMARMAASSGSSRLKRIFTRINDVVDAKIQNIYGAQGRISNFFLPVMEFYAINLYFYASLLLPLHKETTAARLCLPGALHIMTDRFHRIFCIIPWILSFG